MAEDSDPFNIFDPDTRSLVSPSRAGMLPQEASLAAVIAFQPATEVESQDTDKTPTSTTTTTSREIAAAEPQPAQEPSTSTPSCSSEAVNLDAPASTSSSASVTELAGDQPRLEQKLDASPPHSTQNCDINTSTTMASTTTPIDDAIDEPTQDLIASSSHSAQLCDADAPPTMSPNASVTKVSSTPPRPEASPSHSPACDLDTSATTTQTTLSIDVATDEPTQDLIASSPHPAQACDMETPPATTLSASVTEVAHDQARPERKLNVSPSHSQACDLNTPAPMASTTLPIGVATDEPTQDLITSSSHSTPACNMEAPPPLAPSSSTAETVDDEPRSNSSPLANSDQALALNTTPSAEIAVSECSSVQEPQTPTLHATNTTQNDGSVEKNASPTTSHSTSPLNKSTDDEVSVAPDAAASTRLKSTQASNSDYPHSETATTSKSAIADGVVYLGCELPPPDSDPFKSCQGIYHPQDYYPNDNVLKVVELRDRLSNTMKLREEKQVGVNGKTWQESWGRLKLSFVGTQISYEFKIAAVEHFLDQMDTPNWSADRSMEELAGMNEKLNDMITLSQQEALMKRTVIEYSNAQQTIKMHMHFKEENKLFSNMQRKDFFETNFLLRLIDRLGDLNNLRTTANMYRFANKTSAEYIAAQKKLNYWIDFRKKENDVINSKKNLNHAYPPGVMQARNADCLGELTDKPHETIYHSTGVQTRLITKPVVFKKVYGRKLSDAEWLRTMRSVGHPDYKDQAKLYYGEPFVKDSSSNKTQSDTCDSGFQTMDYKHCEANLLKAESKAKTTASKLNKVCLKRKDGLHVYAEPSKDKIVHSQQYKIPMTIHRDGSVEHTTSFTPKIHNIIYDDIKTQPASSPKQIRPTEILANSKPSTKAEEKLHKISSFCASPPTNRFEQAQKDDPELFEQGWPKEKFPVDDTGAYSENVAKDFWCQNIKLRARMARMANPARAEGTPTPAKAAPTPAAGATEGTSVGKKRGREAEAPTSTKRQRLSGAEEPAKPSNKRKRDDDDGREAKELATPTTPSKRPRRLPPLEKTLTVFSSGGERPAPTPSRAPVAAPAAAPAATPAPAPSPPSAAASPRPAPTPAPTPAAAPTPARPGRAPRKPTANRGEVRAGFQPYDARAAGRRQNRR